MNARKQTPKEVFHAISRQFTHVPEHMHIYPRTFPDFASIDILRRANFETWRAIGLDDLCQQQLAKVLSDESDFATFVQTKTANNATFDVMIAAFPHDSTPHAHTANELPLRVQDRLFEGINATLKAIYRASIHTSQPLKRLYVGEQFFVDELNDFPFKKTIEQTHLHITGVTTRDFETAKKPTYADIYEDDQTRHVFRDPTIVIMRDLYRELFPGKSAPIDMNTASLVVATEPLGEIPTISLAGQQTYNKVMHRFRTSYLDYAACFTDFEKDKYGRNVPLPKSIRLTRTKSYIERHPVLSAESRDVLQHIANALRPFSPRELYRAFYNNFAGHIGWTFNMDNGTTTLRFAPRTFTESHGYGETDGAYFVIKDRSIQMNTEQRDRLLNNQRLLISYL